MCNHIKRWQGICLIVLFINNELSKVVANIKISYKYQALTLFVLWSQQLCTSTERRLLLLPRLTCSRQALLWLHFRVSARSQTAGSPTLCLWDCHSQRLFCPLHVSLPLILTSHFNYIMTPEFPQCHIHDKVVKAHAKMCFLCHLTQTLSVQESLLWSKHCFF